MPSRLIGERVKVHVYLNRLDIFVGQTLTLKLARIYPVAGKDQARCVNYRHLNSLSAKPQAFRFLQFREELLSNDNYRELWRHCNQQFKSTEACKWMVGVLRIAADHDCEERLGISCVNQQ